MFVGAGVDIRSDFCLDAIFLKALKSQEVS
jgi:hypothetical protein